MADQLNAVPFKLSTQCHVLTLPDEDLRVETLQLKLTKQKTKQCCGLYFIFWIYVLIVLHLTILLGGMCTHLLL